jgi:hypothetical protein
MKSQIASFVLVIFLALSLLAFPSPARAESISFYIYYHNPEKDPDRAFERAATTQLEADKKLNGGLPHVYISKKVRTREDFVAAWAEIAAETQKRSVTDLGMPWQNQPWKIRGSAYDSLSIHVFSHASAFSSPSAGRDGLEFDKSTLTQKDIAELAGSNWPPGLNTPEPGALTCPGRRASRSPACSANLPQGEGRRPRLGTW